MQVWCEGELVGEMRIAQPQGRTLVFSLVEEMPPLSAAPTAFDKLDEVKMTSYEVPVSRRHFSVPLRQIHFSNLRGTEGEIAKTLAVMAGAPEEGLTVDLNHETLEYRVTWDVLWASLDALERLFDHPAFVPALTVPTPPEPAFTGF